MADFLKVTWPYIIVVVGVLIGTVWDSLHRPMERTEKSQMRGDGTGGNYRN